MTSTDLKISEQEIKRYLFAEMSDEERETIEDQFFLNDELFHEITDLENRLVDRYAQGKLAGEDLKRFESSLEKLPERRQKVANAVALQTFIAEERQAEEPERAVAGQSFWQKIAEIFTVKTPAFGYGMAGLLVLSLLTTVILFLENRRQNEELARLQSEQQQFNQWEQRRAELQNQLVDLRQRENELQTRIDTEREASGDLTEELERERAQREKIERELEKIKKEANGSRPTPPQPTTPIIASVVLSPTLGGRGGNGGEIRNVTTGANTRRLAASLSLPDSVKPDERFSVQLNEKNIAQNVAPRISGGKASINITVSTANLPEGANKLSVIDAEGKEVSRYIFNIKKQ